MNSSDNFDEITCLVRIAYKSLLEKGFRYWGTFQSVEDTIKRFSDGEGFVVEGAGKILATITLKNQFNGDEKVSWYRRPEVCFFTQFAVLPTLQKSGLGTELMNFVEALAFYKNFHEIALDTCEHADGLIGYYSRRGYRFIEHVQWDKNIVNYRSVILSKRVLSPKKIELMGAKEILNQFENASHTPCF